MMRKLIYILCVCCWALGACTDNETRFDIPMPAEGLSFTPLAGGAVMHYRLPSDALGRKWSVLVVMLATR